jgi:hypothetical protein
MTVICPIGDGERPRGSTTITVTGESVMNTRVIDHTEGMKDFSGLRIKEASGRISPIRHFKNLVEQGDWEDAILQHQQEIDIFCWILAAGTAALLLPVCFLVMRG